MRVFKSKIQGGNVDAGISDDDAGGMADHVLRHIEYAHDDVPGVRDDQHRSSGFERPFEEHPGVQIVKIVLFRDELDQLQRHHKGQDQTGDGNNDRLRQMLYHRKDVAIPRLGRSSHVPGDLTDALIGAVEHPGQVACDAVNEDFLQPFGYAGPQSIQDWPPFRPPALRGRACCVDELTEEIGKQGDKSGADEGHTAARHELYHGELVVKRFRKKE